MTFPGKPLATRMLGDHRSIWVTRINGVMVSLLLLFFLFIAVPLEAAGMFFDGSHTLENLVVLTLWYTLGLPALCFCLWLTIWAWKLPPGSAPKRSR